MLNKIRKKIQLLDITKEALERREDALHDLVQPAFKAASGMDRAYIEEVHILKDAVSVGYKYRWDDYVEHFEIPLKIFEADDPAKAATEWRNRSQAQKKAKEKASRKKELQRELARLEVEDGVE